MTEVTRTVSTTSTKNCLQNWHFADGQPLNLVYLGPNQRTCVLVGLQESALALDVNKATWKLTRGYSAIAKPLVYWLFIGLTILLVQVKMFCQFVESHMLVPVLTATVYHHQLHCRLLSRQARRGRINEPLVLKTCSIRCNCCWCGKGQRTRSQAVARIADRTASQQTIYSN